MSEFQKLKQEHDSTDKSVDLAEFIYNKQKDKLKDVLKFIAEKEQNRTVTWEGLSSVLSKLQ